MAVVGQLMANKCPVGFILVPHLPGYTTEDFCVAKYEMKNIASKAVSQAGGLPWAGIPRGTSDTSVGGAWKACKDMGAKYDLISNAQWQTIARNIEGVGSNWSGSTIGVGNLNRGHSDASPNNLLSAVDDSNPCFGTEQTCNTVLWDDQKRTHTLSNGAIIWDFAGNAWEWIRDTNSISFGANSYISQITTASHTIPGSVLPGGVAKVVFGSAGDYVSMNFANYGGLGYGRLNHSAGGILRGGSYFNSVPAGVFTVALDEVPTAIYTNIGFRCVYRITP